MRTDEFTAGEELRLPAWWTKPTWQRLLVKIKNVSEYGVTVLPLEGNPHIRFFGHTQVAKWRKCPGGAEQIEETTGEH